MPLPPDAVKWAIDAFRDGRNERYETYARYIAGEQPLAFATELLDQRSRRSNELIDRFDHVYRNTNRARLIGDSASYSLSYPPRCVRRKLVAAPPLEFINRLHQTDIAFLN